MEPKCLQSRSCQRTSEETQCKVSLWALYVIVALLFTEVAPHSWPLVAKMNNENSCIHHYQDTEICHFQFPKQENAAWVISKALVPEMTY